MTDEWLARLNDDPMPWLLEMDAGNPGVRYFALAQLQDKPPDDPDVLEAQRAVMSSGPVPVILEAQEPEGYWEKPGPGYLPKYRSTVWSVSMLAQLGADGSDARIQKACEYLLEHAIDKNGAFSASGTQGGAILCLMGNLSAALLHLGWLADERLRGAIEWMARAVTGEGIAPQEAREAPVRYLKSATCGPGFCCSANDSKPCAWGAVKVMMGFSKLPEDARTPLIQQAIETGLDFLLSKDPAVADYPVGYSTKPSQSWFRFGFPLFYVTDVLQNLEVLTSLGYGADPRLSAAMDLVAGKQDHQGRWKMEYTYNGKTWVDIEEKGKPSKWVTLRALRVLKHARQ
ncbi:MAG TPA: nitrogen fixation protein NifH [Anaerolineae bacterium]|nr:nitrogen fixation protein NifH [Anaerolineae bacterium]